MKQSAMKYPVESTMKQLIRGYMSYRVYGQNKHALLCLDEIRKELDNMS